MPSPLGLTILTQQWQYDQTSFPTTSIFNTGTKFYFKPSGTNPYVATKGNIDKIHKVSTSSGSANTGDDDIYNTRTDSIIRYCNANDYPAMQLKAQDFFYLKDLGVYPNNRLVIARRFIAPVFNDLTRYNGTTAQEPLSTLISWIPPNDDSFFKITFGEDWEDSTESLGDLLNSVGKNELFGGDAGNRLPGMDMNFGFTSTLMLEILKKLGYSPEGRRIPFGDPNLINRAKQRKVNSNPNETKGYSSLKCNVEVTLKAVYEQKFTKGVDSTVVFYDILQNILRFGSSYSNFYITPSASDKFNSVVNKLKEGDWKSSINIILAEIVSAIEATKDTLIKSINGQINAISSTPTTDTNDPAKQSAAANAKAAQAKTQADQQTVEQLNTQKGLLDSAVKTLVTDLTSKYEVKINAIISALSGMPSVPWHVTIGNPKKPFFSSGDMLVEEVSVEFSNTLGFNDLPQTFTVELTLKNGRAMGIQEIFERFNVGAGRSYAPIVGTYETAVVLNQPSASDPTTTQNAQQQAQNQGITSKPINSTTSANNYSGQTPPGPSKNGNAGNNSPVNVNGPQIQQ